MASPADWAYAAGLIDGEGSIMLNKGRPRVQVASSSYELIQYMLDTFGGHYIKATQRDGQNRAPFAWRLNGHAALPFLAGVLPFLRETRKRERARLFLFEYPSDDFKEKFYNANHDSSTEADKAAAKTTG